MGTKFYVRIYAEGATRPVHQLGPLSEESARALQVRLEEQCQREGTTHKVRVER